MGCSGSPTNGDQVREAHVDVSRSTFSLRCDCGRYMRFIGVQSVVICQCGRRWRVRATLDLISDGSQPSVDGDDGQN